MCNPATLVRSLRIHFSYCLYGTWCCVRKFADLKHHRPWLWRHSKSLKYCFWLNFDVFDHPKGFFSPHRWDVEWRSTVSSVVPGPLSSSNRRAILQCFVLFSKILPSCGCSFNSEDWRVYGKLILKNTWNLQKNLYCTGLMLPSHARFSNLTWNVIRRMVS